jgi:hypothetical protein
MWWSIASIGAASLASVLVTPEASAGEPDEPAPALGTTTFGVPRPSWHFAPPLQLQPERARLMLTLPVEWMPPVDPGALGLRGINLDPQKSWVFQRDQLQTRATIGTSFRLHISSPEHSIDFGLRVMPRAAFAVLRFDPTARLH